MNVTTTKPDDYLTSATNRAVGLVCVAHFLSHFYLMLLPPLFPVLSESLGIGYTEIGLGLTAFSIVSGFTQAPMGFLVDHYGPRKILIIGVILESVAFGVIGYSPIYGIFLLLLGVAGIANSVYHPADYVILNHTVPGHRIGRAFSYHTSAGLLGEALAPATILLLASIIDWRIALILCGSFGIVIGIGLVVGTKPMTTSPVQGRPRSPKTTHGVKLLFTAPILMGVLFFIGISVVNRGITGFSVSALHEGNHLSLGVAGTLLSAWLFASPLGVLFGGRIADKSNNHARHIVICFVMIGGCIAGIVSFSHQIWLCALLFALGGFFAGMVSPSRDMLIRSLTPEGQFGKVFGFVSTGFNVGGIVAPPIYGYILDNHDPGLVFWTAALASFLTIVTVIGSKSASADK